MSRADELRARFEAELAVAEAEDRLVEAKADGTDPETLRAIKVEVREARRAFRELRAGSATVSPEPVAATATVEEV